MEPNIYRLCLDHQQYTSMDDHKTQKYLQNIPISDLPLFCYRCRDDLHPLVKNKTLLCLPSVSDSNSLKNFIESLPFTKVSNSFTPDSHLSTFMPLINAERDTDKEMKEAMKMENATVKFDSSFFYLRVDITRHSRIGVGDQIKLTNTNVIVEGTVCSDQFSDEVKVKIDCINYKKGVEKTLPSVFTVEFLWYSVCYERMAEALRKVHKLRDNKIFKYILKGKEEQMKEVKVIQPPGMDTLNDSQLTAVKAALTRTVTLIQGPPGTGKTVVSSVVVYNLVKLYNKKVLVVAPSNTAVDNLCVKINTLGLKVLRIMSKKREKLSSPIDYLCLHVLLREFQEEERDAAKCELVRQADVVCVTCITAGMGLLGRHEFPYVLIDEAAQSTEPLSLIPCVYGAKKLILVGDHKQLGPNVLNKEVARAGFKVSLFERLLNVGVDPYLLSIQYRMHPDLCLFPGEYIYNGLLKSGTDSTNIISYYNTFFYNVAGLEEISPSGTSYLNKGEAYLVESLIRFLCKNGVSEGAIGVITPYEGQRAFLLNKLFSNNSGKLEISNVDGFQGREKEFIIVSLVRSNSFQEIGFLNDKRRMNVALTRAKHGLYIIGDISTLHSNKMWEKLIRHYDERNLILEGPFNDLKRFSLKPFNMKPLIDVLEPK